MVQITDRQADIQSLKRKLLAAHAYLVEQHDQENAQKVKQLAIKLVDDEFTIAFCGHFSAGKSKMINRLAGENLLPSSPIPTSANLVKVRAGEAYAKVFFKKGKPRLYLAPYDDHLVKNYCRDGDQIQAIEISHASAHLPSQTVIMDTPGIDSADDAHRMATESAIHLADLIFYVMDYNHVQSELNFMFTKELTEAGKEVYLVVNQIDKHSDQELSFAAFKTSVVQSFSSWGVNPANIFYTSLKVENHAHNDFAVLQAFLSDRLKHKDGLLLSSILHSLQKVLNGHLDLVKQKADSALRTFSAILDELPAAEQADLTSRYDRIWKEKETLSDASRAAEEEFDAEIYKIMENAYLMPFQTREIAASYLASCQPNFKVGLLFTKQKTLAEKQERMQLFYQEMCEKTTAQLEWHLREFLCRFLREKRIERKDLLARVQSFHIHFSSELLGSAVKSGAHLSGDYVLTYTADVANRIKRLAKTVLDVIKSEIQDVLRDKNAAFYARLTQELEQLKPYIRALEQVKQYEAAVKLEQKKIEVLFIETNRLVDDRFHLFDRKEETVEVIYGKPGQVEAVQQKSILPVKRPILNEIIPLPAQSADHMKHTSEKLQKTAQLVRDLPGFAKLARELEEKAERLAHKGFTVALFGAFSAGKSSFANALIGESVLPVSPNPTTATINKIKPVNALYRHGTVVIKVKEESALLDDVNHALKLFGFHADCLTEAIAKIEKINRDLHAHSAVEKTNYAFLQAFTRGYAAFCAELGTVRNTTLAAFSEYVAREEKSCFVEWIDLYYDCPLTRRGITLVDTPGADSINARHTGVAFDFIKNSDAILFVTYYNHAFSKADREFLIQLGRVKDSFQLDKMFFMINAIDLADSEEEKNSVTLYVREQLIKYGVKNPHLYPLSSLNALKEKQEKSTFVASGMPAFEAQFHHFITHDLALMAVEASEQELIRAYHLVSKLVDSTKEDAGVKQKKRRNIEAEKAAINAVLMQQTAENLKKRLRQEINELIYYSKQRVFLRFNDFFKEAFNPTVLRDDGRSLKKALQNALDELLEQIGFDFAQEMRATTVRLDRFAEKITAEYQAALGEMIRETNQDLSFSLLAWADGEKIDFEAAFQDIPEDSFAKAMGYFKNPKSFFEKNENRLMRDEFHRVLNACADTYLENEQKRIQDLYGHVIEDTFGELISQMGQQTDDFYLSLLAALEGGVTAAHLIAVQQSLTLILERADDRG